MATATAKRPTTIENIKVLQVGEFGIRVGEKTWFGVNEPLTPSHFVVGEGYKVSVSASKTGKKYVNEILGQEVGSTEAAPSSPEADTTDPVKAAEAALLKAKADAEAKLKAAQVKAQAGSAPSLNGTHPTRSGFNTPLTDYDLAIQKQISRAGIYQAALQSPAAVQWATNLDEYISNVRKLSDAGMLYIQE